MHERVEISLSLTARSSRDRRFSTRLRALFFYVFVFVLWTVGHASDYFID